MEHLEASYLKNSMAFNFSRQIGSCIFHQDNVLHILTNMTQKLCGFNEIWMPYLSFLDNLL